MTQFQNILDKYKSNIHKHVWYDQINFMMVWHNPLITCIKWTMTAKISINDLLSPNSWFMQAVKRDVYVDKDIKVWDEYIQWTDRQYHAMRLSILPDEEKIKYLEENVTID